MKRLGLTLMPVAVAATTTFGLHAQTAPPTKYKPAFPGQTDAPAPSTPSAPFNVEIVARQLNSPWSIAFLPDGNFLVTRSESVV